MAIVISGVNNNDKITASDGTIDLLSGVSYAGIITAPAFTSTGNITAASINVGSGIQVGNAGIITATTLIGNVTGNINHTSNLLLQISGSEKFRVGTSGQLGIGGANYGTSGQVLTSGGSGSAATWSTPSTPAVTGFTNGADNRVVTATSGSAINGEDNLTFDGTYLDLGDNKYVRLGASNDFQMWHNGGTGNTNIKQVTGAMYFYTGSDLNMHIKDGTSVDLYYANTKRLETTSTGAKVTGNLAFTSAGQGIDFGSSTHASGMTREILTDYEEGNWTPVFANAASGGTTLSNPSNTQGTYVKVGRIVYLHLGVHGLTKNWAGSNTVVYIRGLPYRSYFNHSGHCIRGGYWGGNDDDMNLYAQIYNYQTYMSIQKGGGAQGRYEDLYWSDMHWEGYGNLTCEMTYETDQGT